MSLAQKRAELDAKRKGFLALINEAGSDMDMSKVKSLSGDSAAKAAEIKRLNDELSALGVEVENLIAGEQGAKVQREAEQKANEPQGHVNFGSGAQPKPEAKSLGQLFVESDTYTKRFGRGGPSSFLPDLDAKTLMSTAAGWAPQAIRDSRWIEHVEVQPTLVDLIPNTTTNQTAIVFMEETTLTNNAAERTEGANNAGEAALAFTPQTSNVREIAVWIPVTREQMDDVGYIQGYINARLPFMLRQRLNTQVMTGNGAPPNLAGLIGLANVNTQALGADPFLDCLYKSIVVCEVTGGAEPNAIAMHPTNWQVLRLTRTVEGIYLLGQPSDPGVKRVWGLPVITNGAVTLGTAVVGDYRNYCELAFKQGVQLEYTDSHASLFIQRTLAILATIRVAFVVWRPAAFTQATGLPAA